MVVIDILCDLCGSTFLGDNEEEPSSDDLCITCREKERRRRFNLAIAETEEGD